MKILFLTPQLPYPPNKGTAIRNYNLIKNLAAKHDIWLLSFTDNRAADGDVNANVATLRECCRQVDSVPTPQRGKWQRIAAVGTRALPDLALRLQSNEFVDKLAELLRAENFDCVQIEGLEMSHLFTQAWHRVGRAARERGRRPFVVLDEHNAEYVLQKRTFQVYASHFSGWSAALYSLIQWQKLLRYEKTVCREVDAIAAVSELDRKHLLKLAPRAEIQVVPNGVDLSHFRNWAVEGTPLGENSVVFTGTMDFRPNVDGVTWFANAIWPQVVRQVPEARFYIVGRNPKPEVQRLDDETSVFVTGAVRDIRPYLLGATISVIPIRMGGGSRLKILEAMAAGVPMVSTELGAEGIDVKPGKHIVIANGAEAFALEVASLLGNVEQRQRLAERARRLVSAQYDWPVIVPRLERLYARLR